VGEAVELSATGGRRETGVGMGEVLWLRSNSFIRDSDCCRSCKSV